MRTNRFLLLLSIAAVSVLFIRFPTTIFAEEDETLSQKFIVKYLEGQTPEELNRNVQKRLELSKKLIVGQVKNLFETWSISLKGEITPEEKWEKLSAADSAIGVVSRQLLIPFPEDGDHIYVIEYQSDVPVEKAVEAYRSLPIVEFAEPAFTYEALGI